MLQIKQAVRYEVPRYPAGGEYVCPPRSSISAVRDAGALMAVTALFATCGPPPPSYFYVTELDARRVIEEVFAERGISLRPDFRIEVPRQNAKALEIDLDGFNNSLQVGYEYVGWDNKGKWPDGAQVALESIRRDSSPHVVVLERESTGQDAEAHLRHLVDDFLNDLKARGVI